MIRLKTFVPVLFFCFSVNVNAQDNIKYQEPPQSIVELADAVNPSARFSKDGNLMLIGQNPGFETIEQISQPVIGIAGLKIVPGSNSTAGGSQGFNNLKIVNLKTGAESKVKGLDDAMLITNISWSPDNNYFAFLNNALDGVELWLVDVKNMEAKRLTGRELNDTYGRTIQWHPDSKRLLVQFVMKNRGNIPAESMVPTGPVVQQNLGVKTPSRTYQYLLQNPHDEVLMDYFLTSQLQYVDLNGGVTPVGKPGIYRSASFSPDGNYILTHTVQKPYSYLVPISNFPFQTSILDQNGSLVKVLNNAPLADKTPISFDATVTGPRSFEWRGDKPATIVWAEAQDNGIAETKTEFHDAVFTLNAPFNGSANKLISLDMRYGGIDWINNNYALVRSHWRGSRRSKLVLINPENGNVIKEVYNRSSEETYTDPGRFLGDATEGRVLLTDKSKNLTLFTMSSGPSPQGDRPFLMKWDLMTDKKDTLFKSKAPYYESPIFFNNTGFLYFSRESSDIQPNYYSVELKNKKEKQLTNFADPYPSLKGVKKSLLSYKRKDGVTLSAIMYLPAGYKKEDGPLPALVWAYPREFKTREAAGQVKGSPYRFPRIGGGSPIFWVTRGYAVLDAADMPIVGEDKVEPNDTFVEQIEDNAVALIDYVSNMGVVDRNRIGVGGHSYGAFMTANLLAHTKLFAAGLARSGAYNRTLTPFGFQGEARTFWQAPDIYAKMSPFNYADKIKTPILLVHGMDDDNSGTFPIQSERLYSAIKGFGGTVRLVMLPKEFHGYRSREGVLHALWEQDQWLEKYVKNRKAVEAK